MWLVLESEYSTFYGVHMVGHMTLYYTEIETGITNVMGPSAAHYFRVAVGRQERGIANASPTCPGAHTK